MRDGVVIRPARRSDRVRAAEPWNGMMDCHAGTSTIDFRRAPDARRIWMRFFDRHIGSGAMRAWVAEREGNCIGGLLLNGCQARARKKGVSRVTLEAAPEKGMGVPFWRKKGFRTVLMNMGRMP